MHLLILKKIRHIHFQPKIWILSKFDFGFGLKDLFWPIFNCYNCYSLKCYNFTLSSVHSEYDHSQMHTQQSSS